MRLFSVWLAQPSFSSPVVQTGDIRDGRAEWGGGGQMDQAFHVSRSLVGDFGSCDRRYRPAGVRSRRYPKAEAVIASDPPRVVRRQRRPVNVYDCLKIPLQRGIPTRRLDLWVIGKIDQAR